MGKIHVNHKIVVVDQDGRIVSSVDADSFATGEPIYQAACAALKSGQMARFQHGARVIKKSDMCK